MKNSTKLIFGLITLIGLLFTISIAPAHGDSDDAKLDLVFVIDTTGSMDPAISDVKEDANNIIDNVMDSVPDARIAVVGYRDFGDLYVTKEYKFSSSKSEIKNNIDDLVTGGGGDWPEAVYEALKYTIADEIAGKWRSDATRVIILMGDVKPHEESDGGDYLYTAPEVISYADSNDVAICTIAVDTGNFGTNDDPRPKFEELADETGCEAFTVEETDDVSDKIDDVVNVATTKAKDDDHEDDGDQSSCCCFSAFTGGVVKTVGYVTNVFE